MQHDEAPFPVITITPEQVKSQETLGTKRKFWLLRPATAETSGRWLFKFSQAGTGQHWAEKIAACVASALAVPHAEVELASFDGHVGAISRNFLSDHHELYHGNQAMPGASPDYDPQKRYSQSSHTFDNILRALDATLLDNAEQAKKQFATYTLIDALIGNTDRHHENWGIVRRPVQEERGSWEADLAPTFDHASSLGRELADDRLPKKCRRRVLEERDGVAKYVEGGRGAIFEQAGDRHGLSPLELVRRCSSRYPELFAPGLAAIAALDPLVLESAVRRIPAALMSDQARTFALAVMTYSLGVLRRLAR